MSTTDLDQLLTASDCFAMFGLDRRFDVEVNVLGDRYRALAAQAGALPDRDKAARIVEKLDGARQRLADPVSRGTHLLELLGGAADAATKDTPPGFRERLAAISQYPGDVDRERERLIAEAARLFRQLGSADPGAVHRERRRQIRQNLNAIRALDARSSTDR
jgi:hypothetical protein